MERPRVLVVEDNRVFRWWMRAALQETGFSVVCAADAREAGWLGACFPFDVLITDWQLTGDLDGFDVLREMRNQHPRILAILVSAAATPELADRAWKAGFDLVLQKPLHVAEVVGSIYSLIGERGLEVGHEAA